MVYELPEPLTVVIDAALTPVAASAKSPASTPLTPSLNVTVKATLAAFVGLTLARLIEETLGAVASHATVLSVLVDAVLLFPAASCAAFATTDAVTEPLLVMPLIATL